MEYVGMKNVNKTIQSGITSMNEYKLESINVMRMCGSEVNEHANTLSIYDNKSEENNLSTSDKEDKEVLHVGNGLLAIYENGIKI